jgi:hypothetical protein
VRKVEICGVYNYRRSYRDLAGNAELKMYLRRPIGIRGIIILKYILQI